MSSPKISEPSEYRESEILGIRLEFWTFDVLRLELDKLLLSFSLQSNWALLDPH